MSMLNRQIQSQIEDKLYKGKVIILYGARQVGKTTLVKNILEKFSDQATYLNCDEPDIRQALSNKTSTELKAFLGQKKLVVLDEAQRVPNIGLTLKLLVDNFPNMQMLATGSSSFELSNSILEPLTGRSYEFHLYPFSLTELSSYSNELEVRRLLERRMIYGMYPEIVIQDGPEAETLIKHIATSYLYKDILVFQKIKHSEVLEKLLQALALQVGNEVSYNELSQLVGVDKITVEKYIRILEQAFIIFRLPPFSRNIRNELKKLRKIYFYDNGIRNALINNFNPLHLRTDTGALWENFMITERIKWNYYRQHSCNIFFWRTHSQQEIDLIEDVNGALTAFEFKWKKQSYVPPKLFTEHYPQTKVELIHQDNLLKFFR